MASKVLQVFAVLARTQRLFSVSNQGGKYVYCPGPYIRLAAERSRAPRK